MNSSLLKFNSYLLYLIPASLVTGPFFPDLFVVISGIIFIYLAIKNKEYGYFKHPLFIIFIIWCLYLIIISLLSSDPYLSLESSLFYFRFGFFALSICYTINNVQNFLKIFTWIFSITFLVVLVDGYIQFFTGYNSLGFSLFYQNPTETGLGPLHRLSGFFGEQLILGSYLSRLLPVIFALITVQYGNSKYMVVVGLVLLISTDVLVFISGERSAFFYLILSSLVIVIFVRKWRKLRISTLIFSLIIIVVISITNEQIRKRMVDFTLEQLNVKSFLLSDNEKSQKKELSNEANFQAYLDGTLTLEESNILGNKLAAFSWHHQQHYESALKMFVHNPLVGIGPKLFRIKCHDEKYSYNTKYGCSTHPHNLYIQLLAETGLIGFIPVFFAFLYICYIFLKQIWHSARGNRSLLISDYKICLFTSLFVSLWPFIPTGSIFNNWLGVIYFMPVGFLLAKEENLFK